jgi:hypothetical protein
MTTNELVQRVGTLVSRPGAVAPHGGVRRWKLLVAVAGNDRFAGRQRTDSPRRGLGERVGRYGRCLAHGMSGAIRLVHH